MNKVKKDTRTYQKRIAWAFARCFVGLAATAFFLYFLVVAIEEQNNLALTKSLVKVGQEIEFTYESLAQERRVAIAYMLTANGANKRGAFPGELSTEFEVVGLGSVYSAQNKTDEWLTLLSLKLPTSPSSSRFQAFLQSLPQLREQVLSGVGPTDVFNAYSSGIKYVWLMWSFQSRTPNAEINSILINDLQLHAYFDALRAERDFIAIALYYLEENITEVTSAQIVGQLDAVTANRDTYRELYLNYAIDEQIDYLSQLQASPAFIYVNASIFAQREAVRLGYFNKNFGFNNSGVQPPSVKEWLNTSSTLIRLYKGLDAVDLEPIQERTLLAYNTKTATLMTMAVLGSFLELLVAGSIIWFAYPVIMLMWRISSSRTQTTNKDTYSKQQRTHQKDVASAEEPQEP